MPHFFVLHDKVTIFEAATARDALDDYCRLAGIDHHRVVAVSEADTGSHCRSGSDRGGGARYIRPDRIHPLEDRARASDVVLPGNDDRPH